MPKPSTLSLITKFLEKIDSGYEAEKTEVILALEPKFALWQRRNILFDFN